MYFSRLLIVGVFIAAGTWAAAEPCVLFPEAGRSSSPDGKFVVRSEDPVLSGAAFSGVFHVLFLDETATGKSRKLYDYVRRAAVCWSARDIMLITDYLSKKSSRVLVLDSQEGIEPVVIDRNTLAGAVSEEQRAVLDGNDHIFIEASSLDGSLLLLSVWGYGPSDLAGFRWRCTYHLQKSILSCSPQTPERAQR